MDVVYFLVKKIKLVKAKAHLQDNTYRVSKERLKL